MQLVILVLLLMSVLSLLPLVPWFHLGGHVEVQAFRRGSRWLRDGRGCGDIGARGAGARGGPGGACVCGGAGVTSYTHVGGIRPRAERPSKLGREHGAGEKIILLLRREAESDERQKL